VTAAVEYPGGPEPAPVVIDQPGLYDGIESADYHADPVPDGSLSASGARLLLPPSAPAIYKHRLTHPPEPRKVFDFGHAAHSVALGVGEQIVPVDADSWRTKKAQQAAADARAAGAVPLLCDDYQQVLDMVAALREHPVAGPLFEPGTGRAEQSAFWIDPEFEVWRRCRFDWLPDTTGRPIVVDYKTAKSADPVSCSKALDEHDYYRAAPWYMDGAEAVGLGKDAVFVLVFQEKTAPYLVNVVQPNGLAVLWGQRVNRKALAVFRECQEAGEWPGYSDGVMPVGLPGWAVREHETAWERGDYDIDER
jgi:PDDEXK-like domain of unknown function (DUF3799)